MQFHITIPDIVDILLLALIMFQGYRLIRGTAALSIFVTIFFIYIFWLLVRALNMQLMSSLLGQIIGLGMIALVIVFQQEVRRFLLMTGSRYFTRRGFRSMFSEIRKDYPGSGEILRACISMSQKKTGALLVIGKTGRLDLFAAGGVMIRANISAELLETIFFRNSPLHDGAVIIQDGLILAAGCQLPTTERMSLPPATGMRHRAAMGISEHSDALVILVSEETGEISVYQTGTFITNVTHEQLSGLLSHELNGRKRTPPKR